MPVSEAGSGPHQEAHSVNRLSAVRTGQGSVPASRTWPPAPDLWRYGLGRNRGSRARRRELPTYREPDAENLHPAGAEPAGPPVLLAGPAGPTIFAQPDVAEIETDREAAISSLKTVRPAIASSADGA